MMNIDIKFILYSIIVSALSVPMAIARKAETPGTRLLTFGEGGQIKMLYDRRQRPPSVYLNGKVHIVFNAGGEKGGAP